MDLLVIIVLILFSILSITSGVESKKMNGLVVFNNYERNSYRRSSK